MRCGKKIIGIAGWYGHKNTGDEAVLTSIMNSINAKYNNSEFMIFSYHPHITTKQHKVKAINTFANPIKILKEIYKLDLLIIGGGGILKDVNDKMFLIRSWLSKVVFAKLLGKRVILYAVTIGPIYTKFTKFLVYVIANLSDIVTVRDIESKNFLQKIGVRKKIYVTSDAAFGLPNESHGKILEILSHEQIENDGNLLVGVSLRHPFVSAIELNADEKTIFNRLKIELANTFDRLIQERNAKIIFIPMRMVSPDDDCKVAEDIIKLMKFRKKTISITDEYSPQEIKGIIGYMDILIGMRLHSLIFSAVGQIPMIALNYEQKVKSFMDMIGMGHFVKDLDGVACDSLLLSIDDLLINRNDIKRKLRGASEESSRHSDQNVDLALSLFAQDEILH